MFQQHTHKNYLPTVTGKMKGDMPVTREKNGVETLRFQSCSGRHVNPRCAILLLRFFLSKAMKTQKFTEKKINGKYLRIATGQNFRILPFLLVMRELYRIILHLPETNKKQK